MKELIFGAFLAVVLTLASCGSANGNSTYAQIIPGGNPGVTCYAIYSNGAVVGGNCLKD